MKKYINALLLVMIFGLSACGQQSTLEQQGIFIIPPRNKCDDYAEESSLNGSSIGYDSSVRKWRRYSIATTD